MLCDEPIREQDRVRKEFKHPILNNHTRYGVLSKCRLCDAELYQEFIVSPVEVEDSSSNGRLKQVGEVLISRDDLFKRGVL